MTFLLDTNIVSELKRGRKCHPGVEAWHRGQQAGRLWLSVVTLAELRKGIEKLRPRDPTRAALFERWLEEVEADFQDRVIGVDVSVADRWGRVLATTNAPPIDALLAATALVHGLTLVTRNTKDEASTGVGLLDPFTTA